MVSRCCKAGPPPEVRNKGASLEAPLSMGCKGRLEIQLKRELDLPRIIRVASRGADFTESRTGVIARPGDGHNSVATETRSIEGWMIGDVKDFRSELQVHVLSNREILKDREVHPAVRRSWHLR